MVVGYTCLDEGEYADPATMDPLGHLFPDPTTPSSPMPFGKRSIRERTSPLLNTYQSGPPPGVSSREATAVLCAFMPKTSTLIRAVAATNPRTIVSIVAGSAVVISEWDTNVPAVLQSWYSGMEGGHALADVLLGRVDASGRLPFSMVATEADLPDFDSESESVVYDRWHGWWHLERSGSEPAYPFGFGLSYTSFALGACNAAMGEGSIRVSAILQNTGSRPGSDVIQVYASRKGSDGPTRLVGFARVEVREGESVPVEIEVPLRALAERDVIEHKMVVRPGTYSLRVARNAADPGMSLEVELDRANLKAPDRRLLACRRPDHHAPETPCRLAELRDPFVGRLKVGHLDLAQCRLECLKAPVHPRRAARSRPVARRLSNRVAWSASGTGMPAACTTGCSTRACAHCDCGVREADGTIDSTWALASPVSSAEVRASDRDLPIR